MLLSCDDIQFSAHLDITPMNYKNQKPIAIFLLPHGATCDETLLFNVVEINNLINLTARRKLFTTEGLILWLWLEHDSMTSCSYLPNLFAIMPPQNPPSMPPMANIETATEYSTFTASS